MNYNLASNPPRPMVPVLLYYYKYADDQYYWTQGYRSQLTHRGKFTWFDHAGRYIAHEEPGKYSNKVTHWIHLPLPPPPTDDANP